MDNPTTFSEWLRRRRTEMGATQEELCDRIGFSPSMLRKLEAGERRPSGQIAALLADYFRIPADEREAFVAFARTGVAPGPVTGAAPDNAALLAPWRGMYSHRTNLPSSLTPLVGREREVEVVVNHLLSPKVRLVTLTGAPGIGKTRLALQAAWQLLEHFEDGAYMVDLTPVSDPDNVLPSTARALGLKEEAERTLEAALLNHLREKRTLLLLDNFEQVLDAAPQVVDLMEKSPWTRVLITSREALHVRGERRFPVPPLALPDGRQLPPLRVLEANPSVELFLERARAVDPGFVLTQENAEDVAAICIGLEGLPLAIELAAVRVRHFSVADMRSALGSPLTFLTGGARDLHTRHRTLRAAIEWSHDLLDESEQRLFRYLGVFVGGFTAEAVEMLREKLPGSGVSAGDLLLSLVDKNLVREEKPAGRASQSRYTLLESIREYALEQLARHGQTEDARQRHAAYCLALVEQAPVESQWGLHGIESIDRLETEHDNIRAALDWYQSQAEVQDGGAQAASIALDNLEKGLRLSAGLIRLWFLRGYFAEGLRRLTALVSMVPKPVPIEPPQFRATYARAVGAIGRLARLQGNVGHVRPLLEEGVQFARESGDKSALAYALHEAGAAAGTDEDYATARVYQTECLELYRQLGNAWGAGIALEELGDMDLNEGKLDSARLLLEEGLALHRAVHEGFGAASTLESLGRIAYYQRDYARAQALWEESRQLREEIGHRSVLGYSLALLGWASLRQGETIEAARLFSEGMLLAQEVGAVFSTYWCLVGLGALESAHHRPGRAARLFGAAEAFCQARSIQLSGPNKAELDAEITAARAQADPVMWEQAWAEGSALAPEEAAAFALNRNAVQARGTSSDRQ